MNTRWIESEHSLTTTVTFADFVEALLFVNSVGAVAEEMRHHPDIAIKNYNTVTITTTTHDKGNVVTEKDRALAGAIDALLEKK